ncbi:protein BUD31 homolog 2-like isoform X2 [Coffea arabica]|uniref:Protein BUD31 homolog 2-like isoform X2 n=1 Tax=Coffea arabica TaxID=13443 RepID=A0ABM4URX0_COFAR|nr:protein BUD31 homolog 2-like isoform X2 [Coffea arabica]
MPKVKTNRVQYPEGWELIEPTLNELQAKMREAENDPNDNKRKCEALWPIFKIAHQKSRYVFDVYYRRKEISKELFDFCLDQGYADRNLIAKWKKLDGQDDRPNSNLGMNVFAVYDACNLEITTFKQHVCAEYLSICEKRRL